MTKTMRRRRRRAEAIDGKPRKVFAAKELSGFSVLGRLRIEREGERDI